MGKYLFVCIFLLHLNSIFSQHSNPAILQDSRDLPKVDGAFGFLYRTEDGIAHAAKGEQDGSVRGRFTYTDPTGLKVNYNYNAGSRVTPKYNYNEPLTSYEQNRYNNNNNKVQTQNDVGYEDDGSYRENQPIYQETQQPIYQQPQQPVYRETPQNVYQNQQPIYQDQGDDQRSRPPHLRARNNY
ncbi:uncharacterized protein [Onthophagus taurus]|uniref:uncharacterized protein n=1 Tax=Onthophagus taurus TaxID=166361 RepID=UPI0039BEC301